jgi:hypothetical protein
LSDVVGNRRAGSLDRFLHSTGYGSEGESVNRTKVSRSLPSH